MVEIVTGSFRLGLLPGLGGSLTHLVWTPAGGPPVDLMRHASADDIASGNPSRLASFVMVPFTNRIDGGRIPFIDGDGLSQEVRVPINRPAQNAAIHGFGRLARWTVAERTANRIELTQAFAEAGNPYSYEAAQTYTLAGDHVVAELSVTNRGDRALPFGIGFHPWFDRTPDARLRLIATHAFRMDDRDMPVAPIPAHVITGDDSVDATHDFFVSRRTPFDTPLGGWTGRARLTSRQTALEIEASGALRLVHIFSPPSPDVFCVEPVSHLPDVVNRRHLAAHGDMPLLPPGATLAGAMRLTPSRLAV